MKPRSVKLNNIALSLMITTTAIMTNYKSSYCCHAFFPQQYSILSSSKSKAPTKSSSSSSFSSSIITLKGGYDATIGPDPSNPIQFFTLPDKMCPYAARTLIVLNELNLPYDTVEIRNKPDWYLKINPRGKVPAIRIPSDNNEIVYESAICDEYLCDLYNRQHSDDSGSYTPLLMPNDPMQRAKIRLLNDQCDTILNVAFFTFLMNKDESKEDEMKDKLDKILEEYEKTLKSNGGPYLMGAEFTLADVHVLPFFMRLFVSLRAFKNYHVTEEKYPLLVKWFEVCSERESVKISTVPDERIIEAYKRFMDVDYSFGGLNKNK